jgi:hypothetical protein
LKDNLTLLIQIVTLPFIRAQRWKYLLKKR